MNRLVKLVKVKFWKVRKAITSDKTGGEVQFAPYEKTRTYETPKEMFQDRYINGDIDEEEYEEWIEPHLGDG